LVAFFSKTSVQVFSFHISKVVEEEGRG